MMGLQVSTEKCLIWDKQTTSMVTKTAVHVRVVGNRGTIYFETGPLYCETAQEIFEAVQKLKSQLFSELPISMESEDRVI